MHIPIHIPIQHIENEYIAVSYGQETTEFACTHLHFHREVASGTFWDVPGERSHEFTGFVYVCDNPACEEVLEKEAEDCIA